MIIDIQTKTKHYKKGTTSVAKILTLKCDQCPKIFNKQCTTSRQNAKFHFCSRKCKHEASKLDNVLDKKRKNTCLDKYGVESHTKLEHVKEKRKITNLKKYGVPVSSMAESVKQKQEETNLKKYGYKSSAMHSDTIKKFHETCLERYGTKTPTECKQVREKSIKTCQKNYGVDYPQQSKINRKKSMKTCQEKYGTPIASQSDIVQKKVKQTLMKKYGVENAMQSEVIKKKQQNTILQKYGVTNISQLPETKAKINYVELRKKAHATMKKRGNYGKSKIEDDFYQCLTELLKPNTIERQASVHKWSIDFFIENMKMYIQFDGVYWHGLNRPIDVIKQFKNPRDKVIYATYLRDQEQNKWFKQSNIKLIRIQDEEFRKSKSREKFVIQKLEINS